MNKSNGFALGVVLLCAVGLVGLAFAAPPAGLPRARPTGAWTMTGSMATARVQHTLTRLSDGKVLVVGWDARVEVYDPVAGTWSVTGSLTTSRSRHTATLLANGKVLVAGGANGPLARAELYDPATGTWSVTGSLTAARDRLTAMCLSPGALMAVALARAELFDPTRSSTSR